MFGLVWRSVRKVQILLKPDKNIRHYMKNYALLYCWESYKNSVGRQQSKGNKYIATLPLQHSTVIYCWRRYVAQQCKEKVLLFFFRGSTFSVCICYLSSCFTVGRWTKLQEIMIQIGKEPFWCCSPSEPQTALPVLPEHVQECNHRCVLSGPHSNLYWCDTSLHTFCLQNFLTKFSFTVSVKQFFL